MIMKTMTKGLASLALLAAAFTIGCGSGSGTTGAGGATGTAGQGAAGSGAGGTGGTAVCQGITLYRISDTFTNGTMGDVCYKITMVDQAASDGCNLGVADLNTATPPGLIGDSLNVNYTYDTTTATVKVGTMGALGSGTILCNQATLSRDGMPTDPAMQSCSWHQTDSGMLMMTADYEFDISITEHEDQFAAACAGPPAGGTCTSTWTWHMVRDTTKTAPGCQ
jgi:hypothetical protein